MVFDPIPVRVIPGITVRQVIFGMENIDRYENALMSSPY